MEILKIRVKTRVFVKKQKQSKTKQNKTKKPWKCRAQFYTEKSLEIQPPQTAMPFPTEVRLQMYLALLAQTPYTVVVST